MTGANVPVAAELPEMTPDQGLMIKPTGKWLAANLGESPFSSR